METLLFLAVAFTLAYIVVYTPVGNLLKKASQNVTTPTAEEKKVAKTKKESTTSATALVVDCDQPLIPEDSTLKRHFLTNLRSSLESEFSPRPTCSMLSRHHDALIAVEMGKRLKAA